MSGNSDVAIFKANTKPIRNKEVHWLISKSQLEHVVKEIAINPIPFSQKYIYGIAAWQGLVLPVVRLESFFNFRRSQPDTSNMKLVVKTAVQGENGLAARLMLEAPFDIKVRSVNAEDCTPAGISAKELEIRGLKGVFEWEQDKLLLIPDLDRIARGRRQN